MTTSSWLRLDSGDRAGERVSIPAAGLVVGRSPEADLVLADASVSSRHAELVPVAEGVRLTDLGSKNGTRVGAERVETRVLAHGDRIRLGHVRLTFLDEAFAGERADAAGDGLHRLDVDDLGPARTRGRLLPVVLALALVAAGATWAFTLGPLAEEGEPRRDSTPIDVPGDLLGAGSFEGESPLAGWEQPEGRSFRAGPSFGSGGAGVGVDLEPGDAVRLRSPAQPVRAGVRLAARARCTTTGDAAGALAIELESSSGDRAPLAFRGTQTTAADGAQPLEAVADVLPGYDRARVALEARAAGSAGAASVGFDDAVLTEAPDAAPVPPRFEIDEFELVALGEPARSAALLYVDRPLVRGFEVRAAGDVLDPGAALSASVAGVRFQLAYERAGELVLVLEPDLVANGLVSLGDGECRDHAGAFEARDRRSVLVGSGPRQLALAFGGPRVVRGRPGPDGYRLVVSGVERLTVQVDFREERLRAAELAETARRATRDDRPGEALAAWGELLASVPFDADLVAEARADRARLFAAGMETLAGIRRDFERARFFDLADIYRRNRVRADDLLEHYAGSELESEVQGLIGEIDAALVAHVDVERARQGERLRKVAAILDEEGADEFAEHVRHRAEESGEPADDGDGGER